VQLAQFGRADPGRAGNQLISRDIAVFQRNARGIHTEIGQQGKWIGHACFL
jgi:hypothetical protein